MRSLERLEQQKRLKRQKQNLPPPDEETEEERPRFLPLNQTKTAFDTGADKTFGGINTAPSVFDRKAVFRTQD